MHPLLRPHTITLRSMIFTVILVGLAAPYIAAISFLVW